MWRELTEADVLGVLSEPEKEAYQTAAAGAGQDPVTDAVTAVVHQARGYIADHPGNNLADGLTLPDRVILSALHMIRVELLTRLDLEVSRDRADAKRDAIRFFERVSEGKVAIEAPDEVSTENESAGSCETLASRDRIASREKLAGL